jgi:hypothetical protein
MTVLWLLTILVTLASAAVVLVAFLSWRAGLRDAHQR